MPTCAVPPPDSSKIGALTNNKEYDPYVMVTTTVPALSQRLLSVTTFLYGDSAFGGQIS